MVKVVILPCNGPKEIRNLNSATLLQELQSIVGGYITLVPVNIDNDIQAYCNDEGVLLKLPDNHYAANILKQLGFDLLYTLDCIFGPVVLIGPDDRSLSASALKKINHL